MKKLKFICLFLIIAFSKNLNAQYYTTEGQVYFGAGTSLASYVGGYFGNAYLMRVFSDGYDDDYYYYDDYTGYSSTYYDNDYTIWTPLTVDFSMGYNVSDYLSYEINTTLLWHYEGFIDPQFVSGEINGRNYLDRNSNSVLFAIPISFLVNLHTPTMNGSSAYIKAGPAMQYSSEKYDRIREYYSFDYWGYYDTYIGYLYTVEKETWLPGFTVAMGLKYDLGEGMSSNTELYYSYFKISGKNNSTALALDRAPEAQLIAFKTFLYFSF